MEELDGGPAFGVEADELGSFPQLVLIVEDLL